MTTPVLQDLWYQCEQYVCKKYPRTPKLFKKFRTRMEYKARGGEFKESTISNQHARELCERWVQVIPFLKSGRVIDASQKTRYTKACRPLIRVDDDTPLTLPELLKMHDRHDILNMARRKNKTPHKSVRWETLEFH